MDTDSRSINIRFMCFLLKAYNHFEVSTLSELTCVACFKDVKKAECNFMCPGVTISASGNTNVAITGE